MLNETLKPEGGMRETGGKKRERGDSTDKRGSDIGMRTEIKSDSHGHTHARTSKMDFTVPPCLILHCGNVNQNENENLCDSNWICTDEGHLIGQEEQTNSQNED